MTMASPYIKDAKVRLLCLSTIKSLYYICNWYVYCDKILWYCVSIFSSWNTRLLIRIPADVFSVFHFNSHSFIFIVSILSQRRSHIIYIYLPSFFSSSFLSHSSFLSGSGGVKPRSWYQMWWLPLECLCSFALWKGSTMKCMCLYMQRYIHVCTHTKL